MDFNQFLNASFWFTSRVSLDSLSIRILWGFWGLFFILAIVAKLIIVMSKGRLAPWWSRSVRKLYTMFLTMGILGLVLLFFGYQGLPYLSSRFFYLLWVLGVLIWLAYILVHILKRLKRDQEEWQQHRKVKQYLPGK